MKETGSKTKDNKDNLLNYSWLVKYNIHIWPPENVVSYIIFGKYVYWLSHNRRIKKHISLRQPSLTSSSDQLRMPQQFNHFQKLTIILIWIYNRRKHQLFWPKVVNKRRCVAWFRWKQICSKLAITYDDSLMILRVYFELLGVYLTSFNCFKCFYTDFSGNTEIIEHAMSQTTSTSDKTTTVYLAQFLFRG